jgi:hypothetical protein
MSLLPETGDGVAGANTYAALAYANTYHAAHNNTAWADAENEPKEAALRYVTIWFDGGLKYIGERKFLDPAYLGWPRNCAYDHDGVLYTGVPERLKMAECEMALAHLTKALNEVLARGGDLSSVWVGPITVSWNEWARADRAYPMVKKLLHGLHRGGSSIQRRVERG